MGLIRNQTLKEGDIVCSMVVRNKTYDIDLQMTSKFDFWQDNIGFSAILDRLDCVDGEAGDWVTLNFYRDMEIDNIRMPLRPQCNTFRNLHADIDAVPYIVMAGVFVMPLTHNHVPLFRREPMHTLMHRPDSRHLSLLVVTHILPESPFNECETIGAGDILVAINNTTITTIETCTEAWNSECQLGEEHTITLRMRDGSLCTASVEQNCQGKRHHCT